MPESAASTQNGLPSLFRSIFFLVVLQLVSLVILLPSEYSARAVSQEHASLTQAYGKSAGQFVAIQANKAYTTVMKDTGIEEKVNGLFAPIRADNKLSAKMAQIGEKFLPTLRDRRNSFLYTVYLVILRISQTLIWLWPLGLFAVPLIIDGVYVWKKRKIGYDGASPTSQNAALKIGGVLTMLAFLVFFIPIALPVWVLPLNLCVLLMSFYVVCRNMYK